MTKLLPNPWYGLNKHFASGETLLGLLFAHEFEECVKERSTLSANEKAKFRELDSVIFFTQVLICLDKRLHWAYLSRSNNATNQNTMTLDREAMSCNRDTMAMSRNKRQTRKTTKRGSKKTDDDSEKENAKSDNIFDLTSD